MEHFDNVDKVAFKDLTPEQMACIVKANIEGNVEYYYYTKWYKTEHNDIYLNRIYRTIPKPAKKLDIPWNILHTQWKYATFDYEGVDTDRWEYVCPRASGHSDWLLQSRPLDSQRHRQGKYHLSA